MVTPEVGPVTEGHESGVVWQYWVFQFLLNFLNIELEVIGQPDLRDTLIAPWPHTSHIDHLLFLSAVGPHHFPNLCMVYKGEYWQENPLNRFAIRQLIPPNSLGVDASSPAGIKELFKRASNFHGGMMILPQGTRQADAPLQEGLFRLAEREKKRIQPVLLMYHGENPLPKGEPLKKTLTKAVKGKLMGRKPLSTTVEFLEPYDPSAGFDSSGGNLGKEQRDKRMQSMMREYSERLTKSQQKAS